MAKRFLVRCRIEGEKELHNLLEEYKKWNKRQPAEIIHAKLYFIALNAMNLTKKADEEVITEKLQAPAREFPDVSLAAVLVNMELGKKGKKGLTGAAMANAVTKFIKKSVSKIQFLRSGWLPAIKTLDYWNKKGDITFSKRFAPKKPQGVKQYGKDKGSAVFARMDRARTWGRITNMVGQGKQGSSTVVPILTAGLQKAVAMEIRSMKTYIEKKYKEQIEKMNKRKTI